MTTAKASSPARPTPREVSPYRLMQEEFRDDPWKLLVGCIMLNLTSARQARPVWEKFFQRWPSAEHLWAEAAPAPVLLEMLDMIRPLGLQNKRSWAIWRMTFDFIALRPDKNLDVDISRLHGVGKYGSDSYNMFCRGYLVEDAKDKELQNYLRWAQHQPEGIGASVRQASCEPGSSGSGVPA